MNSLWHGVIKLPKVLTFNDKISLAALLLVVGLVALLWWQNATTSWLVKPIKGGTYTEGILNQNPYDLDLLADKLTQIGLTYTDANSEIQGALAERWEISNDGKTYTFHLRPNIPAAEVAAIYQDLPNWQSITIETPDASTIVMTLRQPFAPLLSFTSDPVVELGPYIKGQETKNELDFTANPNFILGQPNIQRLHFNLYPDERTLKAALQRQEVMGADQAIRNISGTSLRELRLTERTVLIFNLEKPIFKDKKIREQIRDNKKLDTPLSVSLATTQDAQLLGLANEFRDRAAKLGLTVSINSQNAVSLERDILPTENYDMLLIDYNYGHDGDPYPYWHSSQLIAPGRNYAGYNSKEADILIEQARQTLDERERRKKHEQVQSIIERDLPAIFYPYHEHSYTISNRLKGVKEGTGAVPSDRFTEVWQWFLKAKKQPQ